MQGIIRRQKATSRPSKKGFTIIELLVVVIVIGVLAAAGIGKYQGFAEKARSKTCTVQQQEIESACAQWVTNNTALCETCEGAQWWARDGFSSSHGWSTPPPFSDTQNIANIIRDNRVFLCPKLQQAYGGVIENIPTRSWGFGVPNNNPWVCWSPNYVYYYNGPNAGGSWNGGWGQWYDPSGNAVGHQMVFCGYWGGYSCDRMNGVVRTFIHSNKWGAY